MPFYEYDCDNCQARFEELVGTYQHYPEPSVCPSCGSKEFHKIFSKPSMVKALYEDSDWEASQRKNKEWIESVPEFKTGERSFHVPKGFPTRLQPDLGKTLH